MAPRTARPAIREDDARPEPVRAVSRTRKGSGTDKFHIARHLIPDGVDLQWNVDSVLGRPEMQERMAMEVQGWRPVTPDMWGGRFDGMFMPKGHRGEINVGGLVLMHRPIELTMEARGEELQSARQARFAEEAKIRGGAPDGVDPNFMNQERGSAKANTFLRKERVPSMPVPQG